MRRRMLRTCRHPAPQEPTSDRRSVDRCDGGQQPQGLRFSPTAWAKLLYLRDLGDTEVGGFGISLADDLLYIEDVQLVRQVCTGMSVAFDDQAVADFFDQQVDLGRRPEQFGRIWLHTHPGNSPEPSMTDEDTFARVFGRTDWAVMFILARGGRSHAHMRFHVGPGGDTLLPVSVDFARPFASSDHESWGEEYAANVRPEEPPFLGQRMLLDGGLDLLDLPLFGFDREWPGWEFDPFDELLAPEVFAHEQPV